MVRVWLRRSYLDELGDNRSIDSRLMVSPSVAALGFKTEHSPKCLLWEEWRTMIMEGRICKVQISIQASLN